MRSALHHPFVGLVAVCVSSLLLSAPAAAQTPHGLKTHMRLVNSMPDQTTPGEWWGGDGWSTTGPLVTRGVNHVSNPQGMYSNSDFTAIADYGPLHFYGFGSAQSLAPNGLFLWVDDWIGAEPRAQYRDRLYVTSATLPAGTPVVVQFQLTLSGSTTHRRHQSERLGLGELHRDARGTHALRHAVSRRDARRHVGPLRHGGRRQHRRGRAAPGLPARQRHAEVRPAHRIDRRGRHGAGRRHSADGGRDRSAGRARARRRTLRWRLHVLSCSSPHAPTPSTPRRRCPWSCPASPRWNWPCSMCGDTGSAACTRAGSIRAGTSSGGMVVTTRARPWPSGIYVARAVTANHGVEMQRLSLVR